MINKKRRYRLIQMIIRWLLCQILQRIFRTTTYHLSPTSLNPFIYSILKAAIGYVNLSPNLSPITTILSNIYHLSLFNATHKNIDQKLFITDYSILFTIYFSIYSFPLFNLFQYLVYLLSIED